MQQNIAYYSDHFEDIYPMCQISLQYLYGEISPKYVKY